MIARFVLRRGDNCCELFLSTLTKCLLPSQVRSYVSWTTVQRVTGPGSRHLPTHITKYRACHLQVLVVGRVVRYPTEHVRTHSSVGLLVGPPGDKDRRWRGGCHVAVAATMTCFKYHSIFSCQAAEQPFCSGITGSYQEVESKSAPGKFFDTVHNPRRVYHYSIVQDSCWRVSYLLLISYLDKLFPSALE